MSQAQTSTVKASQTASRLLWIFVGFVAGVVVGAVTTACLVGYAVWNTVTTSSATSVPFVVTVAKVDGAIRAVSDDGIVLPALLCGVVGAVVVGVILAIARTHRERTP